MLNFSFLVVIADRSKTINNLFILGDFDLKSRQGFFKTVKIWNAFT